MTNAAVSNGASAPRKFINKHTKGIGYLSRVREVTPRGADSYWACTICALHGDWAKPDRTYYDVNIAGVEAERVIRKAKDAVDAEAKVFLGFTIGDEYPQPFVYRPGHKKAGQPGVSMKGRLLFVQFINIDGIRVYTAPVKEPEVSFDEPSDSAAEDSTSSPPTPSEPSEAQANAA